MDAQATKQGLWSAFQGGRFLQFSCLLPSFFASASAEMTVKLHSPGLTTRHAGETARYARGGHAPGSDATGNPTTGTTNSDPAPKTHGRGSPTPCTWVDRPRKQRRGHRHAHQAGRPIARTRSQVVTGIYMCVYMYVYIYIYIYI